VFARVIRGPRDTGPHRYAFAGHEATIGRAQGNHVRLVQEHISRRHARLVKKDGRFVIVDLKSTCGTFVNGKRIPSPFVVRETDTIEIGDYTLALSNVDDAALADRTRQHFVAADPTEEGLLATIAAGDDLARSVYADWLEEHEQLDRAEFLRVQQQLRATAPDAEGFDALSSRLGALATGIDVAWRVVVARPAIERCSVAFDFRCPKEWGSLAPTDRDGVRACNACHKHVHYAASIVDARQLAARGHCVALDVTSARWDGDLGEPFGERVCRQCGMDVGDGPSHCPRCAAPIREVMMVGMIA